VHLVIVYKYNIFHYYGINDYTNNDYTNNDIIDYINDINSHYSIIKMIIY